MSTPRNTHQKIQEICSRPGNGHAPIDIDIIGEELGICRDTVVEHIAILSTLGLVSYTDPANQRITLTDSGKLARL